MYSRSTILYRLFFLLIYLHEVDCEMCLNKYEDIEIYHLIKIYKCKEDPFLVSRNSGQD
jgi:hypothetical protein